MKNTKYILTKCETIKRTEKVEYEVEIPENIKNKIRYADKQILGNNYKNCRVADVIDSELIDEENFNLRRTS